MSKENNLKEFLTDVANAIREKKGTAELISPLDFSSEIASIESGGGTMSPASKNDVTFYDYEGTILYSYTKEEFLSLNEMPSLPTRKGLTCQGWNYTMEDAVAYVSKYGVLDVGATYITDDGKTRLHIRIAAKGRMNVPLYFSQTIANGVTIDWGDGSDVQTLSGTGNVNTSHEYTEIGEYTIILNPESGCTLGLGANASSYCVMGSTGDDGAVYCNMLQAVEIGEGVTSIGSYAFSSCYSLSNVVIPENVTSIGNNAFYYCYSLSSVVISDGVTSIGDNAFYFCNALSSVVIPENVTSIGNNAFRYCYSLSSIVIPDSVTSIGDYAFSSCYSLSNVVIPDGVTSIGDNAFYFCYSLSSVVISDGVTSIGDSAFRVCYSLSSIVIPDSVTSIGNNAFRACSCMAFYDFSQCTSIPTLGGTSVFSNIPSDCKIIVPDSLYDTWIAATNWSKHASQIVKASGFNS